MENTISKNPQQPQQNLLPAEKVPHKWAMHSLQPETHKKHKELLYLTQNLSTSEKLAWLEHRKKNPQRGSQPLRWTTVRTLMGSMIGAYRNAHLHNAQVQPQNLLEDREFQLASRYITRMANTEQPSFPTPATFRQIATACRKLSLGGSIGVKASCLLAISWVTAARMGDALLIRAEHITMLPNNSLMIKFTDGKAVKLRGTPFHVTTTMGPLTKHITAGLPKKSEQYLFEPLWRSPTMEAAKAAMKSVNSTLEARSIRRGALQTMALAGVSDTTLLEFSQHRDTKMLHRYLNWGSTRVQTALDTSTASLALFRAPKVFTSNGQLVITEFHLVK
jgi:integrase